MDYRCTAALIRSCLTEIAEAAGGLETIETMTPVLKSTTRAPSTAHQRACQSRGQAQTTFQSILLTPATAMSTGEEANLSTISAGCGQDRGVFETGSAQRSPKHQPRIRATNDSDLIVNSIACPQSHLEQRCATGELPKSDDCFSFDAEPQSQSVWSNLDDQNIPVVLSGISRGQPSDGQRVSALAGAIAMHRLGGPRGLIAADSRQSASGDVLACPRPKHGLAMRIPHPSNSTPSVQTVSSAPPRENGVADELKLNGTPPFHRNERLPGMAIQDEPSLIAKQFACGVVGCGKRFRRAEHLKRHFRCLHTTNRPYMCSDCGKTFNRKDNLAQHQRIHRKSRTAI